MARRKSVKKWILTQPMHLGFIRDGFRAGAVIEHHEQDDKLVIDGRTFDTAKDLEILKKHNWVVPFTEDALEDIQGGVAVAVAEDDEVNIKGTGMKIVKSDEDLMEREIDISHTKPEPKEPVDKNAPLEVIRGDESPEERVARLQSEIPDMPVVKDDGLGYSDSKAHSLNAGAVRTRTAQEVEKMRKDAQEKINSGEIGKGPKGRRGKGKVTRVPVRSKSKKSAKKATKKSATKKAAKKTTAKPKAAKRARKVRT